jgi:short-subunit dehydrogenase
VDVSDLDSVKEFKSELEKEGHDVTWLVNSAGFGKFCSYDDISPEVSAAMIKTNCEGVVGVTLIVLPFMKDGARIINMGSAAAFQPLPYENIYAATKAFVRSYSRALNRELASRAITVTCACPSWVQTDFFNTANSFETAKGATVYNGIVSPAMVAKKALNDAKKGHDMSVVTLRTKFEHLMAKILPQSVIMNTWMKRQKLN